MSVMIDDSELKIPLYSDICTGCKHLINARRRECEAFKEIPMKVWMGEDPHTSPLPEQENDIVYQPKERP